MIFSDESYTANADGETIVATITEQNVVYGFRCISTKDSHVWLMEDTALKSKISKLSDRIAELEKRITTLENVE